VNQRWNGVNQRWNGVNQRSNGVNQRWNGVACVTGEERHESLTELPCGWHGGVLVDQVPGFYAILG